MSNVGYGHREQNLKELVGQLAVPNQQYEHVAIGGKKHQLKLQSLAVVADGTHAFSTIKEFENES